MTSTVLLDWCKLLTFWTAWGRNPMEQNSFLRKKETASHRHEDLESSLNWKIHNFL